MNVPIKVVSNFDWSETRGKRLVIFMPNYKWPELIEYSINQINTRVDPKDYLIIIGNDNVDKNWDHLWDKNVRHFTLFRDDPGPRNSCFVRNYCIKRCESDWMLNKDGEVILTGDFIYRVINIHCPWRAGKIYVLDENQTKRLLQMDSEKYIREVDPTKIVSMMAAVNSYHAKEIIESADGQINASTYFHYAYSCKTESLHYMGGYDEDYVTYGWEDSDVFIRLFHIGVHLVPDYACSAIHPYHFRREDTAKEIVADMRDLFVKKSPADYFRNKYGWGEGMRIDHD